MIKHVVKENIIIPEINREGNDKRYQAFILKLKRWRSILEHTETKKGI